MKKKLIALILIVAAISLIYLFYPRGSGNTAGNFTMVKQTGGSALLMKNCSDKSYVGNISDYIITGTVEKVESGQSGGNIFTYSDISIGNYEKGNPLFANKIRIVTPGGTVGIITQSVEDQPILHQGKNVRLYISQNSGELSISCGIMGAEEIQ